MARTEPHTPSLLADPPDVIEPGDLSTLFDVDQRAQGETWRVSERGIAIVRLCVVLFNGLMFGLVTRPDATAPVIAWLVLAFAAVYSLWVLLWRPHQRYRFRISSTAVSVADATLITAWLYATGGFASPYFPLWYISILAMSFRFGAWETLVGALVYSGAYAGLVYATGDLSAHLPAFGVRVGYIFLVGGLASLLSIVTYKQTVAKQAYQDLASRLERARDKARQHAEEVERTNEDLRQVAHAISHDVREPLRVIDGYAGLLDRKNEDLGDDNRELLEQIRASTSRLDAMIDSLLTYARLDRSELPDETIDLDGALDDALAHLELKLEETGATVHREELARVRGDRQQLALIFQNLIANAVKYSGDAPPEIRVWADDGGPEGMIRVCVEDEGIGIPETEQDNVFEVFQRGSQADRWDEGQGIGLALCRRLVERHDGRIGVASTPGEGSRFWFTLPRADGTPSDDNR